MRIRLSSLMRDLHLYTGLFLSPFVLIFAFSAILLNHPGIPLPTAGEHRTRTVRVDPPPGMDRLDGMERVRQAQQILRQAGVSGEIGPISYSSKDQKLLIPVSKPGYEATVDVPLRTGSASITERKTGIWNSIMFLHKMPGPHLANIRGNWWIVSAWAWLADGTAWLLVFLSVSGVYLWVALRSDRQVGLALIIAGLVSLLGALYAVCS